MSLLRRTPSSWSYQSALELLEQNNATKQPERTNVASIIAAARRNLKHKLLEEDHVQPDKDKEEQEKEDSDSSDDDSDDVSDGVIDPIFTH